MLGLNERYVLYTCIHGETKPEQKIVVSVNVLPSIPT